MNAMWLSIAGGPGDGPADGARPSNDPVRSSMDASLMPATLRLRACPMNVVDAEGEHRARRPDVRRPGRVERLRRPAHQAEVSPHVVSAQHREEQARPEAGAGQLRRGAAEG